MRHLIVEACIARNFIDTSAYFWPGYVPASAISLSDASPVQESPWSKFMEGAPLSGNLISSLVSTPASRYTLQLLCTSNCKREICCSLISFCSHFQV